MSREPRALYVATIRNTNQLSASYGDPDFVYLDTLPENANTVCGGWHSDVSYRPSPHSNGAPFDVIYRVDNVRTHAEAVAAIILRAAERGSGKPVTRIYPPEPTADERLEEARRVLRADYWADVRNVADDVRDEIKKRALTDEDAVREYLDETVDGHSRVIYTGQAIECLLFTDNDSAYSDEMGEEGAIDDSGDPAYSLLARFAFRADITDTLGDIEQLLEDAKPDECEECGEELSAADMEMDETRCADCRDGEEDDEADTDS